MTIYTFDEFLHKNKDCQEIIQLWNDEYKNIYPISEELFLRNISNIYYEASFIVVLNEKVIGFIISSHCTFQVPTYRNRNSL